MAGRWLTVGMGALTGMALAATAAMAQPGRPLPPVWSHAAPGTAASSAAATTAAADAQPEAGQSAHAQPESAATASSGDTAGWETPDPEGYPADHRAALETLLAQAMVEEGLADDITVSVYGRISPALAAVPPLAMAQAVHLQRVEVDRGTGRFSAQMLVRGDDGTLAEERLTGRYDEVVRVPVLSRRVRAGELIQAEDVTSLPVPLRKLGRQTLSNPEGVIGHTAVRTLLPRQPLDAHLVAAPLVVRKGDAVTLRYQHGGLEIRTMGTALESGALGATIALRNNESGAAVRGVVENGRQVRIYGLEQTGTFSGGAASGAQQAAQKRLDARP